MKDPGTSGAPLQTTIEPLPTLGTALPLDLQRPRMARIAKIHRLLQGGKPVTAASLAEELEYSQDTIKRDLVLMRDRLGLPLQYDKAAHTWRYTESVVPFPLLPMTAGDCVALVIASGALDSYGHTSFGVMVRDVVDKLIASLPETPALDWATIQSMVSFHGGSANAQSNMDTFAELLDAMMETRVVQFDYKKPRDIAAPRAVQPLHLVCKGIWYLFAKDPDRGGDTRTFALTRLKNLRVTSRRFTRPKNYRPEEELLHSIGIYGGKKPEHVRLRASPLAAQVIGEQPWHRTQQIQEVADGGFEVTMDVAVNPELEQKILSWGANLQVLEPEGLRKAIRAQAQAILDLG